MTQDGSRAVGYCERSPVSRSSGLADVIELVLDKGLVIDAFIRVSLIGIEILTIDVRVVVASVDTFLRFAEATNRLDLYSQEKRGTDLPQVLQSGTEHGVRRVAKQKTKTFIDTALEKVESALSSNR
jgi:gas vesicle structural protein